MMIYQTIRLTVEFLMFLYIVVDLALSKRKAEYQKLWEKEKAMRMRLKPTITRAELCEYFVMFCKRNNCMVDF